MAKTKKNPKAKITNKATKSKVAATPKKARRKIPIWGWLITVTIALIAANIALLILEKLGVESEFIKISAVGILAVASGYAAGPITAAWDKYLKSKRS